jgi:arylsulfatase A-like enzyme
MDTHSPYVSGPGLKWYEHTPDHLAALDYPRDLDPSVSFDGKPKCKEDEAVLSALYDASLRSTDAEIGRIVDALDRLGVHDDTVVVISGDHGEELGDHGDFGHFFLLYEHNARIPTLFHRPGLGAQRHEGLSTLLDIAPTMAVLAGIEPAAGWEGTALTEDAPVRRPHVLMETFFAGNCLFDHRPIYFGVRTRDHHYLWKEYRDPRDTSSPEGHELYDVGADPGELDNIYRPDHPLIPGFNMVIARRLTELPEITDERIIGLFGPKIAADARRAADSD